MAGWEIYRGDGAPRDGDPIADLPPPPPWRDFGASAPEQAPYLPSAEAVQLVNAALYLRRPLLITGKPGTGKSSLAHAVAGELNLGPVLTWSITSRSTRQDGLYTYDAIGRLQDRNLSGFRRSGTRRIGRYLRLGPVGTAMLPGDRPRVLLIDEIDKADLDLPNDLLNLFEAGEYEIPELSRIAKSRPHNEVATADPGGVARITGGLVRCRAFPFTVLTSNGEREFPPAFLRRCVRLDLAEPSPEELARITEQHLGAPPDPDLLERFVQARANGLLATDQLLNAVYLLMKAPEDRNLTPDELTDRLLRSLDRTL